MRGEWIEICAEQPGRRQPERSLPMRGEWIEIASHCLYAPSLMSLPMRGEWIEITASAKAAAWLLSLPMRGEWIEMAVVRTVPTGTQVSPHAGRVD